MLSTDAVIDIKPYISDVDSNPDARVGWIEGKFRRSEL